MVTHRMRAILENELGYLPEEVDVIEPQIAAVLIEKALIRPETGMPSSWKRQERKQNALTVIKDRIGHSLSSAKGNIVNLFKNIFQLTRNRFIPILIPILCVAVGVGIMNVNILPPRKSSGPSTKASTILKAAKSKLMLKSKLPSRDNLDLNLLHKVQDPHPIERFRRWSDIVRSKFF